MEVPLADSDAAYDVLGGMPNPAKEQWFGIAPLVSAAPDPLATEAKPEPVDQPRPARAKRDWRDMLPSQQAGIRCEEAAFVHFLREARPDDWRETQDTADCVRLICGVGSRTDLNTNQRARIIWHQLDEQYQAWKAMERVS